MKTKITEMLMVDHPILCGGLYGLSDAKLVSSVCNAGGLGFLSSNDLGNKEKLREEIIKTKKLTNKPFGVNISLLAETENNLTNDYIDVIIEEKIPVVETSGNNPSEYIKRLKNSNVKVLHKVVTARHAKKAEDAGADGIILVGYSAGGHPGMEEVGLFVNLPETINTVKIPVIAAGGICNGQGLACALAMGAEGILMGTAFAVTQESLFHQNIKDRILQAKTTDTIVVFKSVRNAFRCLKNNLTLKIIELEKNNASPKELFGFLKGSNAKESYMEGDVENILIPTGQVAGLIHDIPTCKELINRIITEYKTIATNKLNQP